MNNMNMGKEKREAKAHCETTRRQRWQQEQTEDILTSHAFGATVCINVPKLRGQEKMPIQN